MSGKETKHRTEAGEHPVHMEVYSNRIDALMFMDSLLVANRDFSVSTDKFDNITVAYTGPRIS